MGDNSICYNSGQDHFKWDVILSSFTIHNLKRSAQKLVYKNIAQALKPGGVFINADFIEVKDKELMKLLDQQYLKYVKNNLHGQQLKYWLDHIVEDDPLPISAHLNALSEVAQFEVEVVMSIGHQVLYKATKRLN